MKVKINKMKNNQYNTVATIPKSNIKTVERGKNIHKYTTAQYLRLVQALQ
jgi:hypothetical protein